MADNTPNTMMVNLYKIEADKKAEEIKNKAKKKEEEQAEKKKKLKEATDKSYGSKMVKQKESLDKAKTEDVRAKTASTPEEKKKFTEEKGKALEEHTTPVYAGETKEVMENVHKGEAPGLPGSEARAEAGNDINSKIDETAAEAGIAIPEEVKNTHEIAFAIDALQNGNFVDLSNITLPDGTGLFKVNFDQNGNAYPPERADIPDPALKSRGATAFFTVMSVLLSVFTGGLVPPINFGKLLGTEEYWDRVYEQNKTVTDLQNKGAEQNLMNEVQNKQTQERIDLAEANKEKIPAYAQMQEAEAGGTGYQQAALNADLQKAIKGMDIENSQTLLRMTNEQQKEMARLLFDQETSKPVAEYIKMVDAKVDPDTLAKYKRAYQGVTSVDKAFQYIDGIIGSAAQGVTAGATAGLFGGKGNSDKDVKTFNTNMLRKAWGKK